MSSSAKPGSGQRLAALDFGSNTVGYLVADAEGRIVERAGRFVRLGEGVREHRQLADAALERTRSWVQEIADRFRELQVTKVRAVATEAVRLAQNQEALLDLVLETLGVSLEVISGETEGTLTFGGVRAGYPDQPLLVIDIGGGSTEISAGSGGRAESVFAVSLPLGAVTLTEAHGEDRDALAIAVAGELSQVPAVDGSPDVLTVLGGTGANAAMLDQELAELDDARIEGHEVTKDRLRELIAQAAAMTPPQRVDRWGLPPLRADVLIAGFAILEGVLDRFALNRIRASRYSLRHGVLRSLSEHGR